MNKFMILIALYFAVVVIAQTTGDQEIAIETITVMSQSDSLAFTTVEFSDDLMCVIVMENEFHEWVDFAWLEKNPFEFVRVEACSLCGLIRINPKEFTEVKELVR